MSRLPHSPLFLEAVRAGSQIADTDVRAQRFLDALDRWKDEADQSVVPPFIHSLISTPVRDLHTISSPLRMTLTASLSHVLESLEGVRNVIVQRNVGDDRGILGEAIFSRLHFVEHALAAPSLSDPLSSLVNEITPLGWVQGQETLDVALQRMLASGFEEVGVIDGGVVTGVLHVDEIFTFLSREYCKLVSTAPAKTAPGIDGLLEEENMLQVQSSADIKKTIERQKSELSMSPLRLSAQVFCKAYWTEMLLVVCIILDIACSIVVYTTNSDSEDSSIAEQKMQVATGIILFIFLYEAIVRVYGFRELLLRLPFEVIDLSIVAVSVIVYSLVLRNLLSTDSKSVVTLARVIRGLRMFKVFKLVVEMIMRRRMLYNKDGFALDLSFVTKSCIAMSQPAVGSQANFANPIEEVYRFFCTKYPDQYLIYNLCTKETYSDDYFEGRVERIAVEKHNPPRLSQIVAFVESAGKFLDEDPKACIAVHCKEGRARTGVMVSAWLMYSKFAESADDAMKWFVSRRVSKTAKIAQGIPMPSQRRYVHYMEEALRKGGYYTKRLLLRRVAVQTCPRMDEGRGCSLWFKVEEDGRTVYASAEEGRTVDRMSDSEAERAFPLELLVSGDVRVAFYNRAADGSRDELCCFICFHTGFVSAESEVFAKEAVDVASTDVKCKVFGKAFAVRLEFDRVPSDGDEAPPGKPPPQLAAGTALGPFRKLLKPSQKIVDAAVQMRGRDFKVQIKAAMRLQRKVLFKSFRGSGSSLGGNSRQFDESGQDKASGASGGGGSLCCASGPLVTHESVELYRHEELTTGRNVTSLHFSASSYISQTLGAKIARSLVSGNKRRFVEDGFDLDLSYITARIIAMGFPSSGIESSYRNSKEDVYRFFQQRHAAHYRIVNLCSERAYSLDTFHGNCVRYPFPDHNPPALELILPCCAHIHKYLQADPDNVIAIHCKAGKGRTGLIVISYLMYCGFRGTALEARDFYDWARTSDGKGLTIISQIRYAHYFEQQLRLIKEGVQPIKTAQDKAPALVLHRFRMHTVPHFNSDGGCSPSVAVAVKSELDHEDYDVYRSPTGRRRQSTDIPLTGSFRRMLGGDVEAGVGGSDTIDVVVDDGTEACGARVAGDVRCTFTDEGKGKTMFFFTVHTALMTRPPREMGGRARQLTEAECRVEGLPVLPGAVAWSLVLSKHEIDRAAKDARCAHFDPDFKCEIFFSELPGQTGSGPALAAAREAALELAAAGGSESARAALDPPLCQDRECYSTDTQALAAAGLPQPSFEAWLLGYACDPAAWTGGGGANGRPDGGRTSFENGKAGNGVDSRNRRVSLPMLPTFIRNATGL